MLLNTGWKKWDKFLSKFVGKKINCLDIGSYEGASTCWMLNNLCTNPESKVYSIDTWEGSPEYTEVNFSKIEEKFDENVKNTGKQTHHIKIKTTSKDGLLKLNLDKIFFDFIFIDASHSAKDVFTDGVLSWDILKENGILIFDDYEWDKMKKEYFNPKIAIDSFVRIFLPELKTLYAGYQYIIEKINNRDVEKPELTDFYKLLDEINYYKTDFSEIYLNNLYHKNLKFKLVMNEKKNLLISESVKNFFQEYKNTIKNYPNNKIYSFFHLLNNKKPLEIIKNTLQNTVENYNNFFLDNYKNLDILIKDTVLENYNLLKINKSDIYVLLLTRDDSLLNIKELETFVDNNFKIKINIDEINPHNSFKNINDLKRNINFNKKYDVISFKSLIPKNIGVKNIIMNLNSDTNIDYCYRLYMCLKLQNNGGNAIFHFNLFITDFLVEIIYIFKKYYEKIKITQPLRHTFRSYPAYTIECYNFLGIPDEELKKFENICIEISNKNNNFLDYENKNYNYLHSIIIIEKNVFDEIKTKLINFIDIKINIFLKYMILLKKIENYVHDKNNSEKNIILLKNTIYKKQITEFIFYINKLINT